MKVEKVKEENGELELSITASPRKSIKPSPMVLMCSSTSFS